MRTSISTTANGVKLTSSDTDIAGAAGNISQDVTSLEYQGEIDFWFVNIW